MRPLNMYHGSPSEGESWEEWADHSLTHDDVDSAVMTDADCILASQHAGDNMLIIRLLSASNGE